MKSVTYTIKGELTTLNEYINKERGHKFAGSQIKKKETERVAWEIKRAGVEYINSPFWVTFRWYRSNRRTDKDNIAFAKKFILDGLEVMGVIESDRWTHVAGFTDEFYLDSRNPRIEVTIKKHEQEKGD